ncbi:MAG TPA: catalase [Acidimicrobiales bacterium]|nr:catalase [Acidimicrobiales bacterium]
MHTAEELIGALLRLSPRHRPGTRPVHATGVAAHGRFEPTEDAPRFTGAAPLTKRCQVTVRFSNGAGDHGAPDVRRDPRGMAVRFHGPGGGAAFDMVCMTLPVFFVRDIEALYQFMVASVPPDPPVARSRWQDVIDYVHLRNPPKDPGPGDAGALAFVDKHPETCPSFVELRNETVPDSFAARSYHAIHAYRLTAGDGCTRYVRFNWEPVAGLRKRVAGPGDDGCAFLEEDLRRRVADGSIEFVLRAQVAQQGDDTADPTRPWPQTRPRIVLGHLVVDGPMLAPDEAEALAFNPHTLPPGIAPDPGDAIFAKRGEVYRASASIRSRERSLW